MAISRNLLFMTLEILQNVDISETTDEKTV